MTISSTTVKNSYSGNGTLDTFNYTFKVFADADIQVIIRDASATETVKTLTTHYTVTGAGSASGGTIVFTAGNIPSATETVVIRRASPQTQAIDYIANDPFPAESHEEGLDRSMMAIQQLQEEVDRSIKLSRTNTMTSTEFAVGSTARAGKIFGFDDNGELVVSQELGTFKGDWSASTTFSARDIVKDTSNNNIYLCNTGHTSSGSQPISTNTDVVKWDLLVDAASATTASNTATTKAAEALASASAALTSENNAATSETNAAASYDDFDDRYLGAKASNPTVDNDGDALIDGALYFDTTNNVMKVYDLSNTTWKRTTPSTAEQTNINTVSGISSDVTTVASNDTNVTTVATNIASVNTVATNINDVIKVADDLNEAISEVETVANDLNEATSEIEVVANNITNVNTVGTNISNVNTVATDIANVNSVAGNSTNINAVAGNATNINAVNANSSNINAVNANSANITTVAGNNANVSTVAGIAGNVTTVAGISADVTSVAGDATDIGTVATNIANVNSVAGNASNINTVATNNSNVTTVAGSIANVNEVANNIGTVNNFGERYRVQAGEPSVNNDEGDLVYDTNANAVKVYNGTSFDTIQQGITDVAPTRHSIRPSLNLDFANSKVLDPRITFTRGSNATYYDGYTSVKAEENLLKYSQEFDSGVWSKSNITVTANDTTAPDGSSTAETLTATSGGGYVYQPKAVTAGQYVFSVYIKRKTGTGTVQIGYPGVVLSSALSVTSDWNRFTFTYTLSSLTYYPAIQLNTSGDEVYIWGAQLEQRDSLTAYTPTTTSPITKYQPALQTAGNNVARFDHNPTTGESLGLLIEESRTNLLTYSEEFDNVAWIKNASTITLNTIIAPDGTLTADKLVGEEGVSNSNHRLYNTFSATSGTNYTISVYVKAGEYTGVTLHTFGAVNTSAGINVDLTTQNIYVRGNNSANLVDSSITSIGNDWYRISYTVTATSTGTASSAITVKQSNSTEFSHQDTYTGDGYSGIYIWGAQAEEGSFPTSYIKTTGSQVTRSRDSAVMTGTNFSDWYNNNGGTILTEQQTVDVNANKAIFAIGNPNLSFSAGNMIYGQITLGYGKKISSNVIANGLGQGAVVANLVQANNTFSKSATSFSLNNMTIATSGVLSSTNTTILLPNGVTGLSIGSFEQGWSGATSSQLCGTIKKLAYYPLALTTSEIQDLSEE